MEERPQLSLACSAGFPQEAAAAEEQQRKKQKKQQMAIDFGDSDEEEEEAAVAGEQAEDAGQQQGMHPRPAGNSGRGRQPSLPCCELVCLGCCLQLRYSMSQRRRKIGTMSPHRRTGTSLTTPAWRKTSV